MDYMLLLYANENQYDAMSPAEYGAVFGAYQAYTKALIDAGVMKSGAPLEKTTTATTITVDADGKKTVLDGPYVETKEQLGGYYLIDVANLDEALAWAARCPGASHGTVEVRAIMSAPIPA